MVTYSFLKEAKVYLVKDNIKHSIDISSVSFNQTFTEESFSVQNLQNSNIFEGSVINKANVANFELNTYICIQDYARVLVNSLIDYSSFDLFVVTSQDTFKIEKAVITSGSISVDARKLLELEISGEASKVLRVGSSSYTIPGTFAPTGTKTYIRPLDNLILLNGDDLSKDNVSLTLELQNEVKWIPYNSVQKAVSGSTMYPTDYVIDSRILAGSIQRYVTPDTDADLQSYETNVPLRIKIGQNVGGTFYGFDFNIGSCSYTNRLNTGSIFTQNYDWRMTDNSSLSNIISYITQ